MTSENIAVLFLEALEHGNLAAIDAFILKAKGQSITFTLTPEMWEKHQENPIPNAIKKDDIEAFLLDAKGKSIIFTLTQEMWENHYEKTIINAIKTDDIDAIDTIKGILVPGGKPIPFGVTTEMWKTIMDPPHHFGVREIRDIIYLFFDSQCLDEEEKGRKWMTQTDSYGVVRVNFFTEKQLATIFVGTPYASTKEGRFHHDVYRLSHLTIKVEGYDWPIPIYY